MAVSHAIQAIEMSGGNVTSQAIAELAQAAWRDYRAALKAGRYREAMAHQAEFDRLCQIFQGN